MDGVLVEARERQDAADTCPRYFANHLQDRLRKDLSTDAIRYRSVCS